VRKTRGTWSTSARRGERKKFGNRGKEKRGMEHTLIRGTELLQISGINTNKMNDSKIKHGLEDNLLSCRKRRKKSR